MSSPSYTATFVVDQSPQEVFAAVTDVRGWWSEEIEGPTDVPGGEFTYRAGDIHRSKMLIEEYVPDEKVVWLCRENYFAFTEDKAEWTGTRIVFEVSEEDGRTRVRFTHLGLVPEYECFDVCSTAWGGYITGSLKSLITTGAGTPNSAEINENAMKQHV
jgi:hypothetical protein